MRTTIHGLVIMLICDIYLKHLEAKCWHQHGLVTIKTFFPILSKLIKNLKPLGLEDIDADTYACSVSEKVQGASQREALKKP